MSPSSSSTSRPRKLHPLSLITLPTSPDPALLAFAGKSRRSSPRRLLGHFSSHPSSPPSSDGQAYHIMSRTTGGQFLLGDLEKEAFTRLLRRLAGFSGIRILTFAVLDNHFHLLVKVPPRDAFLQPFLGPDGEETLLRHLSLLYSSSYLQSLRLELQQLRQSGHHHQVQLIFESFFKRFCNLSLFVKELKERFSRWFNRHHQRRGTLWMERFKSVLVEDGDALRTMALYIDLNPVRAGIVDDPKDYRWSGYGEACAGRRDAQDGLCRVMDLPPSSWNRRRKASSSPAETYRCWLFGEGIDPQNPSPSSPPSTAPPSRQGISRREVRQVLETGGKLPRAQLLHCKVRWFSDGLALGSSDFIETIFLHHRDRFSPKRRTGAHRIRQDSGNLHTLRNLKRSPVEDRRSISSKR